MGKTDEEQGITHFNKRLEDKYGRTDDKPNYRVVWSDDQFELRYGTFSDFLPEGIYLRTVTETRRVQKYINYIRERWILERLTAISEIQDGGPVEKLSYEPIWTFEDKNGNALPVVWLAIELIVDTVNLNIEGAGNYTKYKFDKEQDLERRQKQVKEYMDALWGNHSSVTDALHNRSGIIVPGAN